jgi:hypothetical protein
MGAGSAVAGLVDGDGGHSVPSVHRPCPGVSWRHGASTGERWWEVEAWCVGASSCSGVPVASPCASCRAWAFSGRVWARLGPVNADVVLVKGKHGQLQEGQGRAADMVRGDGCERRVEEHGE